VLEPEGSSETLTVHYMHAKFIKVSFTENRIGLHLIQDRN